MASGNKRKQQQAEQDRLFAQQQAQRTNTLIEQASKPSEVETELDRQNLEVLKYSGDYSGLPGTSWASGMVSRLKQNQANDSRGAYTMGAQYANPNLLAAMGKQEEAQAAETEQIGYQDAVESRLAGARGEGFGLSSMRNQRLAGAMGGSANMYGQASNNWQFSQNAANQPGFWSQALLAGIGAGGTALGGWASGGFKTP